MRYRYRTAVLAACGVLAVTQAAAGLASAQHPASAEEVTISVSNLPPSTEAEHPRGVPPARRGVRGAVPEHHGRTERVRVGRSPRSPPSSPAARCRPCSRSRSPTSQGLIERGQVADITAEVEALPYAADFNPNVLAGRPGHRRRHLRRADRRLRHRPALQPGDVRGGRARPRRPADDVGRGARGRCGDLRGDRPGRLRPDVAGQHRRLDADDAQLRLRWPPPGADRRRRRRDDRQPGHDCRPRVSQGAALGGQLDGLELPARLGHDQPGVRRRAGRHVHGRLRRLQQPRHRERHRPGDLRAHRHPARGRRRRRARRWHDRGRARRRLGRRARRRGEVDRLLLHGQADRTRKPPSPTPRRWPPTTPRSARRRCRSSAPSSSPSPTPGWPISSTCRRSRWRRSRTTSSTSR